jgi:hypothetical protein
LNDFNVEWGIINNQNWWPLYRKESSLERGVLWSTIVQNLISFPLWRGHVHWSAEWSEGIPEFSKWPDLSVGFTPTFLVAFQHFVFTCLYFSFFFPGMIWLQ